MRNPLISPYVAAIFAVLLTAVPASRALADEPGHWVSISDGLLDKLAQQGIKPGWPGKTAGVAVDRTNGDLYVVVCDQGLWKSTDHGQTFERVDGGKVGGRCETGFALDMDASGGKLMCFMVYGNCAWSADRGATWTSSRLTHLDFGAVDWGASGKCALTVQHERGGALQMTTDGGQTWKSLGPGFKAVGIFTESALLASKGDGILRSVDGGASWSKVSDITPDGLVMQGFNGVGYWTTTRGVLVSRDQGATWSILGAPVDAYYGPYFGKNERSLLVVGKSGLWRTDGAGATWALGAPLPADFKVGFTGPNFAWDPAANVFYASSMGKDTLKYEVPTR